MSDRNPCFYAGTMSGDQLAAQVATALAESGESTASQIESLDVLKQWLGSHNRLLHRRRRAEILKERKTGDC